jgi:mercuric ion transport protein
MSTGKLMSAGVFTAIAASLCCITPVLALTAGSSSIASAFSWIEPARPYLIGVTVVVIGFAWYQKIKPQLLDECGCAADEKPKFIQSKIVTLFAALMIAFPSYAKTFFPKHETNSIVGHKSNIQTVKLSIKGMSCESCEAEVNHEVIKLPGIIKSEVSYRNKNAAIEFDASKTNIEKIIDAVNSTGYKVTNHSIKN